MKKLLSLGLALVLSLSLAAPAGAASRCAPRPASSALLGSSATTLTSILRRACGSSNCTDLNTLLNGLGGSSCNPQLQALLQLLCNGAQSKPPVQTPENPKPDQPKPEAPKPEEPKPEEPEQPVLPEEPPVVPEPDQPQEPEAPETPPASQYTLANGQPITTENIQAILYGLKSTYPEGMRWTNANSYYCAALNTMGYGCAAFAFRCSDAVFGNLPVTGRHSDFSRVRVGDILRINNDSHSVVVLDVKGDSVVVTEGNYNSSVHWGRTLTRQSLVNGNFVATTRYPA